MNLSPEFLIFAATNILALVVAYVRTVTKLSNVQGQLKHLIRQVDKVDDLARDVDLLDRAQIKTAMDLNHAFEKIRNLEDCCADAA